MMLNFGVETELHPYDLVQDFNNPAGNANGAGGTNRDDIYNMYNLTVWRLYMISEVLLCRTYNKSTDVHYFGILLWYTTILELLLCKLNSVTHKKNSMRGYDHSCINTDWPVQVWSLIGD